MASLIDVRDMLALQGRMDAKQLSARLQAMGKAVKVTEDADGCLSGSCKSCPEGKACLREWWSLR